MATEVTRLDRTILHVAATLAALACCAVLAREAAAQGQIKIGVLEPLSGPIAA